MKKKSLPTGWVKCPSVTREGKFFYHNAERRITVRQSWLTDAWMAEANMGQHSHVIVSATTWQDCIRLAEKFGPEKELTIAQVQSI